MNLPCNRTRLLRSALAVVLLSGLALATEASGGVTVMHLRCEYRNAPLGVDNPRPRMSWELASEERGQRQTAYQIVVASTAERLAGDTADLWDSGKIASEASLQVEYAGKPLMSGQICRWKVRVFDKDNKPSAWSEPAEWIMGLLKPEDWTGKWIAAQAEPVAEGPASPLGYHSGESAAADDVKWVQVDLGRSAPIDIVRLHPLDHGGIKGFGFPLRFAVSASDDPTFGTSLPIADHTDSDFANPGDTVVTFKGNGAKGRYVRVTATRLARKADGDKPYGFALGELEVFSGGRNVAQHAQVSAKDSVEQYGWGKSQLTDGLGLVEAASSGAARDPLKSLPIFRRSFTVSKPVKSAIAYFCGLGQHELRLNGMKVGDDLIEPGWTNYRKTCLYVSYDISKQLKPGENVVGVMLGNGMYNVTGPRYTKFTGSFGPPKLIGQIEIEYSDGTHGRLITDRSWKLSAGPITFSSVYGGEDCDARLEQRGWDAPGFNDSNWLPALEVTGPGGKLVGASHSASPIRAIQVFKGQVVKQPKPGVWVYDLGQNCAIIPRITVSGADGQKVHIIPGELLNRDGTVSQETSGGPAWFEYTLGEGGVQTWSPRFTYYGCRYLQVEGVQPQTVQGLFISTSSPAVGEFSCSNDLFNHAASLIRWAMRSNMMSVLTDCPHRERLGWLEQDHLVGPSLMYNFSIAAMYGKVCCDMTDAQLDSGLVPDIAPEFTVFNGGFRDSPEWGSSCVLLPWQLYQWYGDVRVLSEQYSTMRRYVTYLGTQAKEHIVSQGLGDWYDLGPRRPGQAQLTPTSLTATAFYYRDIVVLEQTARLLRKDDEAAEYQKLAGEVCDAFNHALYHPDTHNYATASQTANALPLVMGLAPTEDRAAILANLVDGIRKNDNRLTSGDVGYRYLLKALADGDRSDVIFDMNRRSDRPGYGYIINTGATALTEGWDGSSSQDHFMLGHIMEWFYGSLAGIRCDPEAVAFRKIVIQPTPVGDVTWASATYDSASGTIASSWKRKGERFILDAIVPPNTTASVHVPSKDEMSVTESGIPVAAAPGVRVIRAEHGAVICAVASGHYHFESLISEPE